MPNILIVDDREDILESYKIEIEDRNLGWKIFTAKNENEAEKILSENKIDVVITDLVMLDEESGMKVLERAKEKDPLMMVLIVTAFDKKLDRYKAFEMGAFDCIARNIPGIKTIEEIIVKTKTAMKFREMALDLLEHERKISFLKRYFDPKLRNIIENNPELLNIKRKTVTIVFWDIRGFSKLCEILRDHPDLVAGFLKNYFKKSSEVVFKNNGVLDKFIGDAVMAIFGVFNNRMDDDKTAAINAVRASIEMQKEFNKLINKWIEEWQLYTPHKINIGLGCGIHTGEAIVGNLGTEDRDQFTAIGAHVNFDQRIESRAKNGQILISTTTKQRVQGEFKIRKIDTWNNIKNIPGEFDIFEIKYELEED